MAGLNLVAQEHNFEMEALVLFLSGFLPLLCLAPLGLLFDHGLEALAQNLVVVLQPVLVLLDGAQPLLSLAVLRILSRKLLLR